MILQCSADFKHDPRWDWWGCNLCIFFWYVNKILKLRITPEFMMDAAYIFEKKGWIDNEFGIVHYKDIYAWLGLDVKYYGHVPADSVCAPDEFEHSMWEKTFEGKTTGHFVASDNGIVTYDPYGESNTVRYGHLVNKRKFKILEYL